MTSARHAARQAGFSALVVASLLVFLHGNAVHAALTDPAPADGGRVAATAPATGASGVDLPGGGTAGAPRFTR